MDKKIIKEIISWAFVLVFAIVFAKVLNKYVIVNVQPESGSMEDTIEIGEKVMTFRLAYTFTEPKRGDIVYFKPPFYADKDYIKRILGLPGEVIEGRDGLVYIDNIPLEEDYVTEELSRDFGPYEVPEGSYFMMGDNRGSSFDSRGWNEKFVPLENIHSKAVFRYPRLKWLY